MRTNLLFLVLLLFWTSAFSQIGKEHANDVLKGPVVRVIEKTHYNIRVDSLEEPIIEEDRSWSEMIIEDGYPVLATEYMEVGEGPKIRGRVEIDREGERIRQIRYYSVYGERSRLFRKMLPIYMDDQIVSETIMDGDGKVMGILHYHYAELSEEKTTLTMTLFKPDMDGPQGEYYIESDRLGRLVHIESVAPDTGIFSQRLRSEGDSVLEYRQILSSRRFRDQKDTVYTEHRIQRDHHGNPTQTRIHLVGTRDREPIDMYVVTNYTYTYDGEEVVEEPIPMLTKEALRGTWTNDRENIKLVLGGASQFENGIFSTDTLFEDTRELIDEASSWILDLRRAEIGEWYWNPETSILTFKQNEHEVIQVSVTLDRYTLILEPVDRPYSSALRLRKQE